MVGAASLASPGCKCTGGQGVTRRAIVCTETGVRPATTLVHGERTLVTPGTVQIHGLVTAGRGLVAWGGWQREGTRRGEKRGWLREGVGAGEGCGGLVLFDGNGCRKVSMEGGGKRAPSGKLKPNVFL